MTSSLRALITIILRPERDPEHCTNYHPISLINVDGKLLAKVLVNNLEHIFPDLIHFSQVGFIKNCTVMQ